MSSAKQMIELDGRTLEGGGQLLRNAVAFAALTRTPVRIPNVRQNREQPGLKAQHAAGLHLVTQICQARAEGIEKGSQCVLFDPTTFDPGSTSDISNTRRARGWIKQGEYEADPGTAGSTTLLLQVAWPVLMFPEPEPDSESAVDGKRGDTVRENEVSEHGEAETDRHADVFSTLILRGGTNALHAPQADYAYHVFVPFLRTHVLPPSASQSLRLDIKLRGFYPYGGGLLRAVIPSLRRGQFLRPVQLTERGRVVEVKGLVVVSGVIGRRVANEMRETALLELVALSADLRSLPSPALQVEIESDPKGRAGSGIVLVARTSTGCVLAGSALGSKGVRARTTGQEAARALVREMEEGGCVDCWMQDQMVVFLALARGRSVVRTGRVTLHTRTVIWVAERLTGARFEVQENADGTSQSLITCEGIGLEGRL